jgi:tetratricopeptide (TPR) repeat protein
MIDQSVNRIGNVDYFLERVKQTRAKGDLAASKVELEAGLRLHSDNRELWTNYWNTELELVRRTGAGDIAQIKSRLKSGAEAGIVSEFERHFFNGILLQLEGDLESALNSFDEAVDVANTANQRIQAVAKGAEIRTKLVSLGN